MPTNSRQELPGTISEDSADIVENNSENHIVRMPKKLAPLPKDRVRNMKAQLFLEVLGVLEIILGVLVIVLNILFLYFGINSGWYYFKDSLGTELKVISIGEGIIAGFFYILFAAIFLGKLSMGGTGTTLINTMSGCIIILSLTLVLANACQIGLVTWYVPKDTSGEYPELEITRMAKLEQQQVIVLSMQMISHLGIFSAALGALVGSSKLIISAQTFTQ